jgi:hypothetical protein
LWSKLPEYPAHRQLFTVFLLDFYHYYPSFFGVNQRACQQAVTRWAIIAGGLFCHRLGAVERRTDARTGSERLR